MGHGDAYCIEVAWLCGSSSAFCDFCLLCCTDRLHPVDHGGTLSFPTCTSFTLVRKCCKCAFITGSGVSRVRVNDLLFVVILV